MVLDTDGGIYLEHKNNKLYPRLQITIISSKLAEQLHKILNELGLRATNYSWLANKDFNRQRAYLITVRGTEMFDRFRDLIKPANPKHIKKYNVYKNL